MRDAGAKRSARCGVVDVKFAVGRVVRIEREPEQPLFAAPNDSARDIEIRRRVYDAGRQVDNFDLPRLLHNEKTTTVSRRLRCEKRRVKTARDPLRVECRKGRLRWHERREEDCKKDSERWPRRGFRMRDHKHRLSAAPREKQRQSKKLEGCAPSA